MDPKVIKGSGLEPWPLPICPLILVFLAVLCCCTLARTVIKEKLQGKKIGGQILDHFRGPQNGLSCTKGCWGLCSLMQRRWREDGPTKLSKVLDLRPGLCPSTPLSLCFLRFSAAARWSGQPSKRSFKVKALEARFWSIFWDPQNGALLHPGLLRTCSLIERRWREDRALSCQRFWT